MHEAKTSQPDRRSAPAAPRGAGALAMLVALAVLGGGAGMGGAVDPSRTDVPRELRPVFELVRALRGMVAPAAEPRKASLEHPFGVARRVTLTPAPADAPRAFEPRSLARRGALDLPPPIA